MSATGYLDACGFIPASGGTGNFAVSAAVQGYQTPAAAGAVNSIVYSYRAESSDKTQWEEGFGAYTVSGTTLARTTITANSSGSTSAINFSAAPNVFITALSADLENASLLTSGTLASARLGGLSNITGSLSTDTAISNSTFSDGPAIAQGMGGTWWASGTITVQDSAGATTYAVKLWDGTKVIASARFATQGAGIPTSCGLSGPITNPTGNIRISAQGNASGATSNFKANSSGAAKDCTVSAFEFG